MSCAYGILVERGIEEDERERDEVGSVEVAAKEGGHKFR